MARFDTCQTAMNKMLESMEKEGPGHYSITLSSFQGAGKSIRAQEICDAFNAKGIYAEIVSADDAPDGLTTPEKHDWARKRMNDIYTAHECCVVIIDNTTIRYSDIEQYYAVLVNHKVKKNFVVKIHAVFAKEELNKLVAETAKQVLVEHGKAAEGDWKPVAFLVRDVWLEKASKCEEFVYLCGRNKHDVKDLRVFGNLIKNVAFLDELVSNMINVPTDWFHVEAYLPDDTA